MPNPIDHDDSRRLDWLDYQLQIIGSLGDEAQAALAEHLDRVRAERSLILAKQPATEPEHVAV